MKRGTQLNFRRKKPAPGEPTDGNEILPYHVEKAKKPSTSIRKRDAKIAAINSGKLVY